MTQTLWGDVQTFGSDVCVRNLKEAMDSFFGPNFEITSDYVSDKKNLYDDINRVLGTLGKDIEELSRNEGITVRQARRWLGVLAFEYFLDSGKDAANNYFKEMVKSSKWGEVG